MRSAVWRCVRILAAAGILVALMLQVGSGPFLHGLRAVDRSALAAAFVIGALTTLASAWRWTLVAGGLGGHLPVRAAVAAYYRSQLLNLTLPGGVVGDVHRAVRHGMDVGDVALGIRAAVWDRMAGQAVQLVLAATVLLALPSPVRTHLPLAALVLTAVVGVAAVMVTRATPDGSTRWRRMMGTVRADIHDGLLADRRWVGALLASTVVVAGHVATFLIAARAAGSAAPATRLLPLALLVLLAMSLPLSIAGWGPREGAAAWAFAAAGLTAAEGVATAVTYGVLVLFASLPGAVVLLAGWLDRSTAGPAAVPAAAAQPSTVRSGAHG